MDDKEIREIMEALAEAFGKEGVSVEIIKIDAIDEDGVIEGEVLVDTRDNKEPAN